MNSRRDYLIAEAAVFAIEAMGRLPDLYRTENNIIELKGVISGKGNAKKRCASAPAVHGPKTLQNPQVLHALTDQKALR